MFKQLSLLSIRSSSLSSLSSFSSSSSISNNALGVIGLGHMGSNMVRYIIIIIIHLLISLFNIITYFIRNWSKDGKKLTIYDKNPEAAKKLSDLPGVTVVSTISDLVKANNIIVSILPNDKIVKEGILSIL